MSTPVSIATEISSGTQPLRIMLRLAGELVTKSRRVRARFQRRLVENIQDALHTAGIEHKIENQWSRLFIEAQGAEAPEILSHVFGISSFSIVEHVCPPALDEIVRTGEAGYGHLVRGKTFAVRARRSGEHPFRSRDILVELGAALDREAKVDLSDPQITVSVEVRPEAAYFFSQRIGGAGGMPVGTQGKAVSLISGGFDSAIASWMMLKRGCTLDYVLCNLAGTAYERTVLGVLKVLTDTWSYGTRPKLHVVDFGPLVSALRRDVRPRYVQVVLKRLMYRAGIQIAKQLSALAVVTGESVGQVSSQTLSNLKVIDEVADLPMLRPLVGMDKEEIIGRSRKIGTFALSSRVQEYCALVPDRPVTAAKSRAVCHEESQLDLDVLRRLVDERKIIDVRSLGPSDLVLPFLYTSDVPDDAVVIDVRSQRYFDAWHYPGALRHDLDDLVRNFRKLDRGRTYLLYCPLGLQSAVVAEKMQQEGFEAYTFKGGTPALKQYAKEQGLAE